VFTLRLTASVDGTILGAIHLDTHSVETSFGHKVAAAKRCYHSLIPRAAGRPIATAAAYARSSQNMDPRAPR
jgi:hypothetical protein